MNIENLKSLFADLSFGTVIGIINDWSILLANILLIGGRVVLEVLIQRREARKKAKQERGGLEP